MCNLRYADDTTNINGAKEKVLGDKDESKTASEDACLFFELIKDESDGNKTNRKL